MCMHLTLTDIKVDMEEKLPIKISPTYILKLINTQKSSGSQTLDL